MDDGQCPLLHDRSARPLSLHLSESDSFMHRRTSSAGNHDEPEPPGREGQIAGGPGFPDQRQGGVCDSAVAPQARRAKSWTHPPTILGEEMKRYVVPLALAILAIPPEAARADAEASLKKSGCFGCHAISSEKVGPPFKRVAAKYKGQSEAAARLESDLKRATLKIGGKDVRHAAFKGSDAELKDVVAFILGQ